jgi:glycosyltransferase involved in cell wall biosynthesis
MNILFLAGSLEEGQAGSAHHSVEFINTLASRPDARVYVFATAATDRLHPAAQLAFYRAPAPLKALWRVEKLWEITRWASEMRRQSLPDVNVCYTRSTTLGLAFRSIAPTVPIVSHIGSVIASRGMLEETNAEGAHKWYVRLGARVADRQEERSYRAERWLHLVSTPMVAKARERAHNLPPGFFHTCPLGSSVKRFDRAQRHPDVRGGLGIGPAATVLLTVARLKRFKNVDLVIRALAALRRDDSYLIVVGGGPEMENLKRLAAECGVAERTRFVGRIAEPAPYYATGDVFVMPSSIESFGNVYAEAMLMGLPCIGMRHHPPEILSSAEDVIPEGTAGYCISELDELVERLDRLTGDAGLRRELGENAYRHARQNYTIERYAETVLGLARSKFGIA